MNKTESLNETKEVNTNDKITVIEEALLKNISGGASSKAGELFFMKSECTGK